MCEFRFRHVSKMLAKTLKRKKKRKFLKKLKAEGKKWEVNVII